MNIGKQIKRLRIEKQVTQETLADYLGVTYQAVSKWENDITTPDISLLPDLSVFFGVKIDELFQLPSETYFERIENMFYSKKEIGDEDFRYIENFLNKAININKCDSRAYGDLAHLYNHRSKTLRKHASDYAKKAIALEPEEKNYHVALWDAMDAVCGDYYYDNHFEVIQYYKSFIEKYPNNYRGLIILIENLFVDGRHKEAKKYIERLKDIKQSHIYYMYLGDVAYAEGSCVEARALWNQGVNKYNTVWQAYCCRADRLTKIGLVEDAIKDYRKSLDIQESPKIIDGILSLAQIYEEQGKYELAIKVKEEEIQIMENEYGIINGESIDKPRREIKRLSKLMNR